MPILRREPVKPGLPPIKDHPIAARFRAEGPDNVTRFKCIACAGATIWLRTYEMVCTYCDGKGIMTRLQFMSFGRTVPYSPVVAKAIASGTHRLTEQDRLAPFDYAYTKKDTPRDRKPAPLPPRTALRKLSLRNRDIRQ